MLDPQIYNALRARNQRGLLTPDDANQPAYDPSLYEDDPRGLLSTIADVGLGAVGAVGNLLDLPGSMIRDTLTLNNPFDQLLSPLSSDNRTTGREMLTQWGLTSENKETGIGGWADDPMEGVQDVAGFAAEMAFDPLSLLAGWSRGAAAAKGAATKSTGLLGKAGDAIDAIDPGVHLGRAAHNNRGLLTNIADPLHLREFGEKHQLRDKLRSGAGKTKDFVGRVMDRVERSPHFGTSFGAARQFTRTTADDIQRTARQLFDAGVSGANKAINQKLMKTMTATKEGYDDAVKSNMIGLHRQINQQLMKDHGPDIFDKLDAGSEQLGAGVTEAVKSGESLIPPITQKLEALNFAPEQIDEFTSRMQAITSDADSLGMQFQNLKTVLEEIEHTHVQNVQQQIVDPLSNESFQRWKDTGNRPRKELFTELGWREKAGDLVHETGGVLIGQQKKQGHWFVFDSSSGELERIGNFRQKSAAIERAHEFMRSAATENASAQFDDADSFLKMFADHDRSTMELMKQAKDQSDTPGWLSLREEIRAAAEGAQHDFQLLSPQAQELAQQLRPSAEIIEELSGRGFSTGPLNDDYIEFAFRRQGEDVQEAIRDVRGDGEGVFDDSMQQVVQAVSSSTTHRDPAYTHWMTGSAGINRYFRDPELAETMNRVNQGYATGQLNGKIGAAQADNIRETLRNTEIGGETAEKLFDDLIDGGMIDLKKLDKAVSSIADKIAAQSAGVVSRTDGSPTRKWVKGGQGRQFYVFDDITSTTLEGDYNGVQFRVDPENPQTLGESGQGFEQVNYREAQAIIDEHKYVHQAADKQDAIRDRTRKLLDEAERDGQPVFIRSTPDQGVQLVTPRVYDTLQKRLKTQLGNLARKFDKDSVPDEEQLEVIQKQQLIDFTRKKYGSEIDDRMPRRDTYGARMAQDYRGGLTGNQLSLSDDAHAKLVDEELITDDLQEAMQKGMVYELVDSRIEKAIVPKLYAPDGGYLYHKERGVFTNDPLVDHIQGSISLHDAKLRADVFESLVESFIEEGATYGNRMNPNRTPGDNTLERLLDSQKNGVNPKQFLEHMAKKRNPKLAEEGSADKLAAEVDRLKRVEINSETWADLAQALDLNKPSLLKLPGVDSVVKYTDAITRLFKVGVLGHPARITRDFTSAALRSIESGMIELSTPRQAMSSFKLGNAMATGKHQTGFADLLETSPGLREQFEQSPHAKLVSDNPDELIDGSKMSEDEAVFHFMQDQFFVKQGGTYLQTDMEVDGTLDWAAEMGAMDPLLEAIPNFRGLSAKDQIKESVAQIRKDGKQAFNPLNVSGMPNILSNDPKLKNKPIRRGKSIHEKVFNRLGQYTDALTRAAAVIDQMKRGSTFDEAFSRAKDTLVNYDPRRFSRFEKDVMKRVFPFYSFLSSQVPYVMKELFTNPTGGLGMTVRAQRHAQDDEYVPRHMRDKAAIPLGRDEHGNQNYISSLGLMHEDAVAMLKPDPAGLLKDIGANLNPLLKFPIETMTGVSLFMEGPTGGQPLRTLDPPIGRVLKEASEAIGLKEETDAKPQPFLSPTFENFAANSPTTRLVNTARTLLDDRKSITDKLLNTLTGVKIQTVSPERQQGMLQGEINKVFYEAGRPGYTRFQVSDADIAELREDGQDDLADKLAAAKKVKGLLDDAQKRRKKSLLEPVVN